MMVRRVVPPPPPLALSAARALRMAGVRPTKRQRKEKGPPGEGSVGPVPEVEVQVKMFEAYKPHLLMEVGLPPHCRPLSPLHGDQQPPLQAIPFSLITG